MFKRGGSKPWRTFGAFADDQRQRRQGAQRRAQQTYEHITAIDVFLAQDVSHPLSA